MSRMIRTIAAAATIIAVVASVTPSVGAQPYPSQPVHFLVAFAPGGVADLIARIVGQKLSERWQQPVIIENRGGAGGNIAASLAAKAEPNGYTILVTTSAFAVNPSLYKKPGYHVADFDVAGFAATTPNVIVGAQRCDRDCERREARVWLTWYRHYAASFRRTDFPFPQ